MLVFAEENQVDLKQTTLKHLSATPQSFEHIANEIGVTSRWLYYFADGKYEDPGVQKTQRLYTHLTGKKLKLVKA